MKSIRMELIKTQLYQLYATKVNKYRRKSNNHSLSPFLNSSNPCSFLKLTRLKQRLLLPRRQFKKAVGKLKRQLENQAASQHRKSYKGSVVSPGLCPSAKLFRDEMKRIMMQRDQGSRPRPKAKQNALYPPNCPAGLAGI